MDIYNQYNNIGFPKNIGNFHGNNGSNYEGIYSKQQFNPYSNNMYMKQNYNYMPSSNINMNSMNSMQYVGNMSCIGLNNMMNMNNMGITGGIGSMTGMNSFNSINHMNSGMGNINKLELILVL
jgi:hypothetical protein